MTKIKFFKAQDRFVGFECSGHTGYDEFGRDILCATLSGITQACVMGIQNVLHIKASVIKNDDNGYLKIELPHNLDESKLRDSQILLETLYISVSDLISGYSKYISMEVIENDY